MTQSKRIRFLRTTGMWAIGLAVLAAVGLGVSLVLDHSRQLAREQEYKQDFSQTQAAISQAELNLHYCYGIVNGYGEELQDGKLFPERDRQHVGYDISRLRKQIQATKDRLAEASQGVDRMEAGGRPAVGQSVAISDLEKALAQVETQLAKLEKISAQK